MLGSLSSFREPRLDFCLGVEGPARELLPAERIDSLSEATLDASKEEADARIEDLEPRRGWEVSGEAVVGDVAKRPSVSPGVEPGTERS